MPHECFADEIAIDFPSVGRCVERMRDRFLGEDADTGLLCAEVSLSKQEAFKGQALALEVPILSTCTRCGGRGETWTERCDDCDGTGQLRQRHPFTLSVPRGVADGSRLRFRVKGADGSAVTVEVRIAIRSAV